MLLLAVYKLKQKTPVKLSNNRKRAVVFSALVLLGVGGIVGYQIINRFSPSADRQGAVEKIDLNPPTETEKNEVEKNKDKIIKDSDTPDSPGTSTGNKKTVTPIVTNASVDTINAYVPGVFEEGGTCTATFTKDSTKLVKTSTGFQNVSYTQCAPIDIESGFLSSGKWNVTINYSSTTAEGTSGNNVLEVK